MGTVHLEEADDNLKRVINDGRAWDRDQERTRQSQIVDWTVVAGSQQ